MNIKMRHVPLKPAKLDVLAGGGGGEFYFNIMNIDLADIF